MTLGYLWAISHDTFFLDATFEALDTATTVARKHSSIFGLGVVCPLGTGFLEMLKINVVIYHKDCFSAVCVNREMFNRFGNCIAYGYHVIAA